MTMTTDSTMAIMAAVPANATVGFAAAAAAATAMLAATSLVKANVVINHQAICCLHGGFVACEKASNRKGLCTQTPVHAMLSCI